MASVQFSSVAQLCPTLCDPMNRSTPGLPVRHQLPGLGEAIQWLAPWFLERLKVGGERDDRGQDGWMAPLTQCTWDWADSGRQWRTGKPDVLQSMGLQRAGHDLVAEWQQQNSVIGKCVLEHPQSQRQDISPVRAHSNVIHPWFYGCPCYCWASLVAQR